MKTSKAYKILTISTISLPMLILLIFFYISGNQGIEEIIEAPKVIFINAERTYNFFEDPADYWSVDLENNMLYFHGDSFEYKEVNVINGSIVLEMPDFFSMNGKYYTIGEEGELVSFSITRLVREKMFERNFIIGLNIILLIFGISSISLLVIKKMDLLKRHRRLSVLLFSFFFTVIWLMLALITTQLSLIFLVFTFSWGVYYVEWLMQRHKQGLPLHDQISQRVVITNE